jgi:hypothetical protein
MNEATTNDMMLQSMEAAPCAPHTHARTLQQTTNL